MSIEVVLHHTIQDKCNKTLSYHTVLGGGAWTAGIPNNMQHIGIDLGYRQVVTGVATQGRRGSFEYVTEYYIEFSTDNKTWSIYTNRYGTPLVSETVPLTLLYEFW